MRSTFRAASTGTPVGSVIVVGGGVSGLTTAWALHNAGVEVTVLEAGAEPGGTATSGAESGFIFDRGPNGFLTSNPATWQLAHDLGIAEDLVEASPGAKRRYLLKDSGLVPLPSSPVALMSTPLLTAKGKIRAAREPFVRTPAPDDESVHAFFERRFGAEVANVFAVPMVMGITSGDAREVSIGSLFPRLVEAEAESGSVLRGMMARRKNKQEGAPSGRLCSLRHGMGQLTRTLAEQLGERVHYETAADGLRRDGDRWCVSAGSRRWTADAVVTTIPALPTAELLQLISADAAEEVRGIRYAGVRVISLGFNAADVTRELDGFGFLVPRGGRARILGCVWTSTVFPGRAAAGRVLIRVIAGGTLDPAFTDLGDAEALSA
ncbi:MAG: oxygen-dependent protoporphyrinogen oxidase, partial [Flavobacteriales bacterium]